MQIVARYARVGCSVPPHPMAMRIARATTDSATPCGGVPTCVGPNDPAERSETLPGAVGSWGLRPGVVRPALPRSRLRVRRLRPFSLPAAAPLGSPRLSRPPPCGGGMPSDPWRFPACGSPSPIPSAPSAEGVRHIPRSRVPPLSHSYVHARVVGVFRHARLRSGRSDKRGTKKKAPGAIGLFFLSSGRRVFRCVVRLYPPALILVFFSSWKFRGRIYLYFRLKGLKASNL